MSFFLRSGRLAARSSASAVSSKSEAPTRRLPSFVQYRVLCNDLHLWSRGSPAEPEVVATGVVEEATDDNSAIRVHRLSQFALADNGFKNVTESLQPTETQQVISWIQEAAHIQVTSVLQNTAMQSLADPEVYQRVQTHLLNNLQQACEQSLLCDYRGHVEESSSSSSSSSPSRANSPEISPTTAHQRTPAMNVISLQPIQSLSDPFLTSALGWIIDRLRASIKLFRHALSKLITVQGATVLGPDMMNRIIPGSNITSVEYDALLQTSVLLASTICFIALYVPISSF